MHITWPRLGAFLVEDVELVLADLCEVVGLERRAVEEHRIVELPRVGEADQPARLDVDRERLIVVEPVHLVGESGLRHELRRAGRAGECRAEHAVQLLARVPVQRVDVVLVEGPLLVRGQAEEIARVVDAVGDESQLRATIASRISGKCSRTAMFSDTDARTRWWSKTSSIRQNPTRLP